MKQRGEEVVDASMEYEEILDNWENHNKTSAKEYIQVLCDKLRRKHPLFTNKDIRKQITKDVLNRGLCSAPNVSKSWPEWVMKEKNLPSKKIESEVAQSQSIIEEYKIVDDRAKEPQEEKPEPVEYAGAGEIYTAPESEMPTPTQVYVDTVRYSERLWSALTTTDVYKPKRLIPSQTSDPLLDFIKPSRKMWLRTLKGLSQEDASHMQMCLVWLDMLIQDRLQMSKEINKERKEIER